MNIEFVLGVGHDYNGQPILNAAKPVREITEKMIDLFGGCNIIRGYGAWKDEQGKLVAEPSLTIVVDTTEPAEIRRKKIDMMAEFICEKMRQSAVHVTTHKNAQRDIYIHRKEEVAK